MLFTSYEFIGFVAVLLLVYYIIPKRMQWQLLLVASLVFYAMADPRYLLYIMSTIVVTYISAKIMQKRTDESKIYLQKHGEELDREAKKLIKKKVKLSNKRVLVICIVINAGILIVVKYINFIISNINGVLQVVNPAGQFALVNMIVPMGISFYTFMALGYITDVYRGTVRAEDNLGRLALFLSFFPSIVQGPINRYGELKESLFTPHQADREVICQGLWRVLWGFFKKLVVADRLMPFVMAVVGASDGELRGAYAFFGMLFYTIQLYADFTGGIDITIGIGKALGITIAENFNRPYFSKSLKEYWRRWHITMCSWFRDYVFYPVSTSSWMGKLTKWSKKHLGDVLGRRVPVYLSSFIVWFLTGLWHGASWNFIVWGLLNYLILMISEELEPLKLRFHARFAVKDYFVYRLFQVCRTFALICVLNLFDCFEHIGDTVAMLLSIFTLNNWNEAFSGGLLQLGMDAWDYAVVVIACVIMLAVSLLGRSESLSTNKRFANPYIRTSLAFVLFISIVVFGAYGIGYDSSQFIYNRF